MDETSAAIEQITADKNNKGADNVRQSSEQTAAATEDIDIENQSEKYDISPENLEKSSCDITPNDDLSTSATSKNETSDSLGDKPNADKFDAKNKSTGFAFTIDFNEGKAVDNRKYREIAERFQHRQQQQQEQRRHRRGVSLSKLDDSQKSVASLHMENGQNVMSIDDSNVTTTAAVATKPPFKQRNSRVGLDADAKSDEKCDTNVVLRRPRPTTDLVENWKDSSKRHSWSPRSSLNYDKMPQLPQDKMQKDEPPKIASKCMDNATKSFQPKSTILQRALEISSLRPSSTASSKALTVNSSASTNLAGKKLVRDHVVSAPLEYVRNSDDEDSTGDASQATYTLDGDNYTEEEKERMSIDKLGKQNFDLSIESRSPNDLNRNYTPALNNLLKTNYSHAIKCEPKQQHSQRTSSAEHSSKGSSPKASKSYLDKIKTRVKTIGDRTFHKNTTKPTTASATLATTPTTNKKLMNLQVVRTDDSSPVDSDHGVFTSITACGVLNKQNQEETNNNFPANVHRKQSLTKFQIDSSEYIQPKVDDALMSSYTDYEKAKHHEYKLKIFSTISSYTSSGTSPVQTDDDNLSVDDKPITIKTAPTKNDWIQEWARNARRRNNLLASSATASPKMQHYAKTGSTRSKVAQLQGNDDRMSQSYDTYFHHDEQQQQQPQFGDDVMKDSSDECTTHKSRSIGRNASNVKTEFVYVDDQKSPTASNTVLRPPISPTKIPSPMHSQLRARSSSVNRSFHNSNADLDGLDTEMYLEKTAAAISSLQKIHRKNNSPQNTLNPKQKTSSNDFATPSSITTRNNYENSVNLRPLHVHKRNLSLDVSHNMAKSKNNPELTAQELKGQLKKQHTRHNSYENKQIQLPNSKHGDIDQTMSRATFIEQQRLLNAYLADSYHHDQREGGGGAGNEHARRASYGDNATGSPIRRSSSFCNRNIANIMPMKATTPTATKKAMNRHISLAGNNALQKSASSSSFKKLQAAAMTAATAAPASAYQQQQQHYAQKENEMYYINDRDNLQMSRDELLYSSDGSDDANSTTGESGGCGRYESDRHDRQISEPPISHTRYNKAFLMRMEQNKQIASGGNKGVVACPNTPEMPRRANNQRASFRDPTSMPRDSSLSRMKQDLPNLQTTKKALTQAVSKDSSSSTSSVSKRVLPKYMDISKYRPVQGQSFLKRDESRSTLINRTEIRKSPSAIGLSKGDPMRTSGRVKSAGAKPSTSVGVKDTKAREQELAMWRRRATYDPMKAAAEGRKKQEEAKKAAQSTKFGDSSAVLRSQSFHSGVGQLNNPHLRQQFSEDSFNKDRWAMMSTESSDEEEFGDNA